MTTAPTRRVRPSLTPGLIVDSALQIVEEDGPDALTFRRLGRELGCAPTAVLRHFRDKDDLLLALGERLLADALTTLPTGDPDWRVRLRALGMSVYTGFLAHPRVTVLVSHRTLGRDAEFQGAELVVGTMLQAGLSGLDAAVHYRVLVDGVLAWTAMEATTRTLPAETLSRESALWTTRYAHLPVAEFPALGAVAEHLATADATDMFPVFLECLIEAIGARGAAAS